MHRCTYFVVVRVHNCLVGVAFGETLRVSLTVDIIFCASVLGEMRALRKSLAMQTQFKVHSAHLMDQCAALGIGTGGGSLPECTAEIHVTEAEKHSVS